MATLSIRAGAPVLIWPAPVATERSLMKESSVSPERWEMMVPYPYRLARAMTLSVSERVPIWFSLMRTALATPSSMPLESFSGW